MPGLNQYTYLDTRVAILRSRLLSRATLDRLIEEPGAADLSQRWYLKSTPDEWDTTTMERAGMHALLTDLAIILRPLSEEARDFFIFWARRFELYNLKALIRGKLRGLPDAEIARHLQDMPSFTVLDHEQLLRTESVAELLRQIEAGPYGDIARQARQVLEEKQDTLAVEAAIDQRYYAGLVKRVHRLPAQDMEPMHELMGVQVDRINLTWLVRYRFSYGMSPSETYYFLIRHGNHLRRSDLLRLVELENYDEVITALPDVLARLLKGASEPLEVERRLETLVLERAQDASRHSTSPLTRALAYLLLRECELNRLRAIHQGRSLGIEPALIRAAVGDAAPEVD